MSITKRQAHYGSPKQLLNYILDEKHDGEKVGLASSINCNVETALMEFIDIQKKYNMKGKRVAYHIIQSFSPKDNITPEQANEIGKKLCIELYPDFQCVISTHIDKGHLHNHISVNAINLNGRKLDDRLSNEKEGLYGLSDTSDRIASEYGCYIMPRKKYFKDKNKDYYYQYKEQSWKEKIKEDIESIISKCNSVDEFIDELSIIGYEVKRGKHISVRCFGMERFARLSTIDEKYSTQNLYKFYKSQNDVKLLGIRTNENEFNSILWRKANESKLAIEKSQLATEKKRYNEYQQTKYKEVKRYYQLKKQLEYLEKYDIKSFDDIEKQVNLKRNEIKTKNIEIKKQKDQFEKIIKITEKAQDYIKLSEVYDYALSYKKMDSKYILPKEAEIFLQLQQELKITSVDEAKNLIKETRAERIKMNGLKQEVLNLQRELNHLDTLKEEKLSKSGLFIHNIKFGGNRIDYNLSDDEKFCINLPYTNEKIYVDKKFTAYNEKNQFYTLYLVDDKEYELFDKDNKKLRNITGTELEKYVLGKKKEIDMMYSKL